MTNGIQKVWSSLSNNGNANTFIGDSGRLFYDPTIPVLRISDGITPGGIIIGGESNQISGQILEQNLFNLPNQSNYNGAVLMTNGKTPYWSFLDAGEF